MPVRLHESWIAALRSRPETGMGYQVLELRGVTARPEHVIVTNASEALDVARHRSVVREGTEKGSEDQIAKALSGPISEVEFQVLSRSQAVFAKVLESSAVVGAGPANQAEVGDSTTGEEFLRFSAFRNDVRILADGSVSLGTYVTTYSDGITYVKTGTDAVRRYALPNPVPAIHRYYLRPPTAVPVQRGTVQPAHGQPGGGAEVIFVAGAPAKTKYDQDQIPPR